MDLLASRSHGHTFNFWNDYLGLSTQVVTNRTSSPFCSPNSITESLKATLGLQDHPGPPCGDAHPDWCGCCAAPDSVHELMLRPHARLAEGDPPLHGGSLLSAVERRRRQSQRGQPEPKACVFCRNNGEPGGVYTSHTLKAADGRVLCPVLRAYTCPLCSASGENAHTIKYCPLSQRAPPGGRAARRLKF